MAVSTIGIQCFNMKENHTFWLAAIGWISNSLNQMPLGLDDLCASPDLDSGWGGVIHQEDEGAVVFSQIAYGNVLAVTRKVSKGKGVLIQDFKKALWATPMLYVWPAVSTGRSQVEGIALVDEVLYVRSDSVCPSASIFNQGVGLA